MAKIDLNIFSFDSRIDFQNGYVRECLHSKHSWFLKDLLEHINSRNFGYQEFGVNLDFINIKVNNHAIFENIKIAKLLEKFGKSLTLEPLSKKYVKKDLLVDYTLILQNYDDFFRKFNFIAPSEREKLLEFLPFNFINGELLDDEYIGDGFVLYVKWLCDIYPLFKQDFLKAVSLNSNGIFNHTNVANFIYPENNEIDENIESMQKEILHTINEYEKINLELNNQYNFSLKAAVLT
ncbi:hypothetical protein DCO58_10345 [Helicobacter saguini]|uniref:DUF5644 domain-containing protein n=1 Tax=Helicobacter saguini TaxID=1548018 RepID=A0A347VPM3_9HELI|nr:DUF5644 domain-containing protein [Helicobacter saguini]MWV61296.1 hypothetical protein [Helicobacter saguini]MWV68035.1 hypothetical protein [Helicobacter saguini]MWV70498.1 hypothetical protein [Helicobacter saguini]MWV72402.1 hypothetical protein [Helicobacter saguini]TLD91853.1 hypothetical protein LS64_011280 [Helicobacter saguini]